MFEDAAPQCPSPFGEWVNNHLTLASAPYYIAFLPQLPVTPKDLIAKQALRQNLSLVTRAVDVDIHR